VYPLDDASPGTIVIALLHGTPEQGTRRLRSCGDVAGSRVLPRGTPSTRGAGGWFIRVLTELSPRGVPVSVIASRDERKGRRGALGDG